jgi:transposase-like protein
MRQIARELGVNVTTVRKWKETNQTSSAGYSELRKKLSTLTNEVNFYPPKLRQKPFDVA